MSITKQLDRQKAALILKRCTSVTQGTLATTIGVSTEITELKETEGSRLSEEHLRVLTQNSSAIVTLLGADGTIRYQSSSVERILGYRPKEMIEENIFDYVYSENIGWVPVMFAEGLADSELRSTAEYRFRSKDGSWCYWESVGSNAKMG